MKTRKHLAVFLVSLLVGSVAVAAIGGTGSYWLGNKLFMGDKLSMASNSTTCTLNGGTPSTCTATVTASAKCVCTPVGATAVIAAGGCAVGLSGTTLTATSFATGANVVNIICDR